MLYLLLKPGSGDSTPIWFKQEDKIVHFGLFAVWAVVGCYHFYIQQKMPLFRSAGLIVVIGILLAIGTELIQHWVPKRQADKMDAVADTCGVLAGVFFVILSKKELQNGGKNKES